MYAIFSSETVVNLDEDEVKYVCVYWPFVCTGVVMHLGAPFYVGLSAAAAHLAWQIQTVDLDSRQDCLDKFQSNKWFGAAVFGGIAAGRLLD